MTDEKYVLVSLDDEKAEKIAGVLANKTSKRILDLLAEKELSESGIAKELKIPLNTAGYNIGNLKKAGLIEEKKHLWSVKGKRIPIYKLASKYIIISPKKTKKISAVLPVVVIASVFSAFILLYQKFIGVTRYAAEKTAPLLQRGEKTAEAVEKIASGFRLGSVEIFLIMVWLAIAIFIILTIVRRSK